MLTKLDLPQELLRKAEEEAMRRGSTLDELMGRALARELDSPANPVKTGRRTRFPIFEAKVPGTLRLSEADIRRAEYEDDLRRGGLSG